MNTILFITCIIILLISIYHLYSICNHKPYYQIYDISQFEFFEEEPLPPDSIIAIASLIRKPIDLPLWLEHHRKLGITYFYIRLEDTNELVDYLKAQKDVILTIATSDKSGNNYHTLQDRQVEYVDKILQDAKTRKINWVFHIDADELLHGSLRFLDTLNNKYKTIWIENVEAIFNIDKNKSQSSCFSATKFLRCHKGAPCRSYVNGKSAGRVIDHVGLKGPHYFHYKGQHTGNHLYNVPFNTLRVLHFDSCSFTSWIEKFHHLSKQAKKEIPFKTYNESIVAVENVFNTYTKYVSPSTQNLTEEQIYIKE